MPLKTVGRLSAAAAAAALAISIVGGPSAQAGNVGGGCLGVVDGKVTKVNCKTGKPLSVGQQDRQMNAGWDLYAAKKADNGTFNITVPKRMRGQDVTVTVTYTTGVAPAWLKALGVDEYQDVSAVRTEALDSVGKVLTVVLPTSDFVVCYGLAVVVKAETGRAYKYYISGYGDSFTKTDNGYTDITIEQ